MADSVLPPPFDAYVGSQPYVFISYSHRDSVQVFPEIHRWASQGYRVWYDEGIDPGNEWPEEIARALLGCSLFVVFISPRAVASQNVRNEVNFALDHKKPLVAIHLEDTNLPPGLQLRLGDLQAILKWRMREESFRKKVDRVLPESLRAAEALQGDPSNARSGRDAPSLPSALALAAHLQDMETVGLKQDAQGQLVELSANEAFLRASEQLRAARIPEKKYSGRLGVYVNCHCGYTGIGLQGRLWRPLWLAFLLMPLPGVVIVIIALLTRRVYCPRCGEHYAASGHLVHSIRSDSIPIFVSGFINKMDAERRGWLIFLIVTALLVLGVIALSLLNLQ
jgi:hypothetical protein